MVHIPSSSNKTGTVAVIDIGSSAIRLVVAEIDEQGSWRLLDHAGRAVRLGHDVFTRGEIGRDSLMHALQILTSFREMLSGWKIAPEQVKVIATSAVREAINRDQFTDRVALRTGFRVSVIEGIEANHLTFMAVQHALEARWKRLSGSNVLIMEVGGGSTEVMMLKKGTMVCAHSLHLGTVRLQQTFPALSSSVSKLERYLKSNVGATIKQLDTELPLKRINAFVAVGGSARIAARHIGTTHEHYSTIQKGQSAAFIKSLMGLSIDQMVGQLQITYEEAESLLPSMLVFEQFIAATGAVELIVPEVSIREGLLISLSRDPSGRIQDEFCSQIIASAVNLGRKLNFDEQHALNVSTLATQLFDQLQADHGLNRHHRLLLEIAALLHDVGKFINESAHHKHSQYIVQNSDVFGLNSDDMRILSNVVRYHRKSLPTRTHISFMSLQREERLAVMKMAALLRVADALDTRHSSSIRAVSLERGDEELFIRCSNQGDLSAERHSIGLKGDLFEETFGLRVILETRA